MTKPNYIVEFIMTRNMDNAKAFVLVEGTTDRALWGKFAAEDCHLRPAQGKDTIVDVLSSTFLKGKGMNGIAGIVDADYWLLTDADELGTDNLLYDDCCPDAESILLDSGALKKVLRHSINADDMEQIHQFADTLITEAQRLAMEFGYFRLLNECEQYGISFNCFWKAHNIVDFIDNECQAFDRTWFARKLADHHKTRWIDKSDRWIPFDVLLEGVGELEERYPTPDIRLCRGKDVVAIMAHILPALFKTEFGKELSEINHSPIHKRELAKDLRMAYEFGYFMETSLFACIRRWEGENEPYRIIRDFSAERTSA